MGFGSFGRDRGFWRRYIQCHDQESYDRYGRIKPGKWFFGAYLRFSGFDGIVFQGKSPNPVYLIIRNGKTEIRDAGHLSGKDVHMVEDDLRKELGVGELEVSIYAIGPAGENKVLYSAIVGDRGHVAAHGGAGAVMGSKNLKAVVAFREDPPF